MNISDTLTEDEREDLRRAAAFGGRAEAVIGTIDHLRNHRKEHNHAKP